MSLSAGGSQGTEAARNGLAGRLGVERCVDLGKPQHLKAAQPQRPSAPRCYTLADSANNSSSMRKGKQPGRRVGSRIIISCTVRYAAMLSRGMGTWEDMR